MASHDDLPFSPLTWIGGERRLARRVGRPVRNFLRIEAAGGILLLIATIAALVWANSPWSDSYHDILETHISIHVGDLVHLDESVLHWINDGLMAIFFFVVGLEIKRELVVGELRDPRAAALPAIAAIGGMVVPAAIFIAFNSSGPEFDGWGIPMATDIAFAVGVVSLLGNRVPSAMKVFLLTLAIVDDIGAIAVIAIFYTDDFSSGWFLVAMAAILLVLVMRVVKIWWIPAYVLVGAFVWLAVFESGIHATIAGVVLGLITPAVPLLPESEEEDVDDVIRAAVRGDASAPVVRRANFELKEKVSVVERLEDVLHPFSSYLIIPIFALANAGVELSGDTLREAATAPLTLGVVFGLVVGKIVGVSLATGIAVKSGIARLPRAATWTHVFGLSAIAGIGFTVSLFITGLAFDDALLVDEARIGILAASAIAAVVGVLILLRAKAVVEVDIDDAEAAK
ncbi:MAG: Na(+)/H(+) antiporter NhaA [Acidimicrobiales bacterium]|nr:MAG: Na(+)/H(+) antiporter NhaA [Acidimicrobiales bacterium]